MEASKILQQNFLLSVQNLKEGRFWTLVTSAFSHISPGHLFFNMLAFHQLGQVLVYTTGLKAVRHFGILILGSALAGSTAFLSHEGAMGPHVQRVGLGFSAVVSGVVTAAACLMPHQRVLMFGVIPLPLWALGIGYVVYDTYSMEGDSTVAHDAHIGGAIFGGIWYMLVLRRFGGILGPRFK
jgi:membrane associated rhomboid family serine protease